MSRLCKVVLSALIGFGFVAGGAPARADDDAESPKQARFPELPRVFPGDAPMATATQAHADRRADDRDGETNISMGLMAVGLTSSALLLPAGGRATTAGLYVAGFSLFLAPSAGRLAGGDLSGTALHLGGRVLVPGAIFALIYSVSGSSMGTAGTGQERQDNALLYGAAAGAATMLAMGIYDVATTSDDLRRKRRAEFIALTPMAIGARAEPGLGVVGRF